MKLLTKLGNTLLDRLAPETQASAACSSCNTSCYYTQYKCVGVSLYKRCCCIGNGNVGCYSCGAGTCYDWVYCGPGC
ncbi:hypothetical protein ABZ926_13350 [Streptomyces litmocidini]|uniref:hypothetical protein n=1 Tax=Streptomyces litmocidini TaxID=67318 RepID=UPI003407FB1A